MKGARFLWCIVIVCAVGVGSALSAQDGHDGHDALLAEVRALRAELHEAANASIRAQLYAVGFQLQEQRAFAAGRQLADVQRELADIRQEIEGEQARVRHLQTSLLRAQVTEQTAIRQTILTAEAHIEEQQRRATLIQSGEAELQAVARDARARWEDFNAKLSALEQSLPETTRR
jgi:chromosome segregation ATPase